MNFVVVNYVYIYIYITVQRVYIFFLTSCVCLFKRGLPVTGKEEFYSLFLYAFPPRNKQLRRVV